MALKYKIIEVNDVDHTFVVRYYTDLITEENLHTQKDEQGNILRCRTDYNILMPVPALSGAELDAFIVARAPKDWFAALEHNLQNPSTPPLSQTLLAEVNKEKVGDEIVITPPAPQVPEVTNVDLVTIRAQIQSVLESMTQGTV